MKLLLPFCIFLVVFCQCCTDPAENSNRKPNVLFIAIDDLRPELGCYGKDYIHSPNIDALAKESTVFSNHFVQVPTCGASRMALLTGMLPISKAYLRNGIIAEKLSEARDSSSGPETFIHHLKNNGYHTIGLGKISHSGDGYVYGYTDPKSDQKELPNSWSDLDFNPGQWENGWNAFFAYAGGKTREAEKKQVKPYEMADVNDDGYPDGLTAELAIEKLKGAASKNEPFFLGVGFFKPHLPFNAPKKYWDLYNRSDIELAPYDTIPLHSAASSLQNNGEFNQYAKGEERAELGTPVSEDYAKKLKHGYYASISYIDAQVGKVLDALKELKLEEETIVVLWGDHGWNLGDYSVWGKHTLFDRSLNSAFIIKAPGVSKAHRSEKVVSTIDLYPTLMELCGIEMPHKTDGKSLTGVLKGQGDDWKNVSFGYWRNGITVRNDRYRLMQYFRNESPEFELYDHKNDPFETENVADQKPEVLAELMEILENGDTGLHD